jgi:hypothetical protein
MTLDEITGYVIKHSQPSELHKYTKAQIADVIQKFAKDYHLAMLEKEEKKRK